MSEPYRAQQSEFGGIQITAAEAEPGLVTAEVEVSATSFGPARGELGAVAEQVGQQVGSITDSISQTQGVTTYRIEIPVAPVEGFAEGNVTVTVGLREAGTLVDTATTSVSLPPQDGSPSPDPPENGGGGGGSPDPDPQPPESGSPAPKPDQPGGDGFDARLLAVGAVGVAAYALSRRL